MYVEKTQSNHKELSFLETMQSIGTRPQYTGGIWHQRYYSDKRFRPHYAEEIWKRNNERSVWICIWGKFGQGHPMVIMNSSFL